MSSASSSRQQKGSALSNASQNTSFPPAAYGVSDTASMLSIGRTKLYGLVKAGEIRATKIGRKTLFLAADIDAFLDRLQRTGGVR
jgi:excisionase family DNA binding protein